MWTNGLNVFYQGRKAEEQRAMRLTTELGQFRHEAERRLQEKEEEIEVIRWVDTSIHIRNVEHFQH